ncbi:MAG: carboxypeptidase regulatory-like domain-containing protein [Myxococcales bacterium]|nr:carboxypeptidase regulatory-like domain-containing protein [Myxococcales bacterium]
MLRRLLMCGAMVAMAGCTLDTELPRPPPLGAVTGSVDTQGKVPPEGVVVTMISSTGARQTTTTAAAGRFDFAQVTNGQYFVEVKQPGFVTLVVPGVVVRGGETFDTGVLQPIWLATTRVSGTIQGRVTSASGVVPVGGKVEFLVGAAKSLVSSGAIDFAGEFSALIPPGDYTLRASHPFFVTKETTATIEENRVTTLPMPIVLDINPATLSGKVVVESSTDGMPPAPRAGITVTVDTGASAVTDAMGQFTVTGLPAGARTFRVTLMDFDDPTPERTVTLEPAMTKVLADIVLERQRGAITGEVELADGKKISDVTVVAAVLGTPYASSVSGSSSQQSRGRFVITRVPVGTYTVRASSSGYASADQTSVRVEANRTVDIGLLRLAALSGNFRIEDTDTANTPGFTRSRNVTLDFSQFLGAVRVRFAENDPSLTSVMFQNTSATPIPFTLSTGDGTKVIYAQYETATGTQSAVQAAAIVVDTQPPQLASLTVENGATFTNDRTLLGLTAVAADEPAMGADSPSGLAFMRLSPSSALDMNGNLSGPREAYTRDRSWTPPSPLPEGSFTLYAQFIDNAGNVTTAVSDSVIIDTLLPSGGLTIARGSRAAANGFTNDVAVILNATATMEPNGGSVQVRLANTAQDVATAVLRPVEQNLGWFLDPIGDGLKTVHYQFVDAAGNASGVQSATITLDRQPPSPAAVALPPSQPDSLFNVRTIPLQLQAADVNGLTHTTAVTVSMSATFTDVTTTTPVVFPMSSTLTYDVPAGDGPKTLYVRYRDIAGNEAFASLTVTLDQTAPTADVLLAGTLADGATATGTATSGPTVSGTTATVVFQNPNGIADFVAVEGTPGNCNGPWSPFVATQVNVPVMSGNGARSITVCLRDAAGNVTGPTVRTLTLDTSAPACTLALTGTRADGSTTLPLPAGQTGRPGVTVTFTCGAEAPQDVALVQGSVTCVPNAPLAWVPYRPSTTFSLSGADGLFSVTACVRDPARNTTGTNAPTITLDTTAPSGVLTLHGGRAFFNRTDFQAVVPAPAVDMTADVVVQGSPEWALSESSAPASFVFSNPTRYRASSSADGPRTVYVLFRDAVGNLSSLTSDTIDVDITAPAATNGDLAISNANGAGYLNQSVAAVDVRARPDATTIRLAVAASPAACAASDVQNEVPRAASGTYSVQLTGADGPRRICAEYVDAAGNTSPLISRTVALDSTPPNPPRALTQNVVLATTDNAVFFVDTTNANDANSFVYEVRGGKQGSWTPATPGVGPNASNRFTFNLDVSFSDEEGTLNVLRVHAKDLAGNVSDEAVVQVIGDSNLPDFNDTNVPNLVGQTPWVDNADRRATFHWKKSSSADVTGYVIEYGSDPASMTGSFASEGISPIVVGDVSSFTLSGLPNESPTYVRVRPRDRAGNVGPFAPTTPANAVILQPNEVSLNYIGSVSLPLGSRISRLVASGDHLFFTSTKGVTALHCNGAPPPAVTTQLHVLSLAGLEGAVQNGKPQDAGIPQVAYSSAEFADGTLCINDQFPSDLVVDGLYAFMTSGTRVRVFDIGRPELPSLVGILDFGPLAPAAPYGDTFQVKSVQVTGDRLIATGNGYLAVLSLAELYDGLPGTFPVASGAGSDLFAFRRLANPSSNNGDFAVLTRDRLLQSSTTGALTSVWDLGDALDSNIFTFFDAADELGATSSNAARTRPPVGGNYFFQGTPTSGFEVLNLSQAWGTLATDFTTISSTGFFSAGQLGVGGNQVFLGDTTQDLQVLDLSDVSNITRGAFMRSFSATHVELYGNYAITAHHEALGFYEVATPRSMRVRDTIFDTGYAPALANGLLMSTGGIVVDTMSSGMRVFTNENSSPECSTGSAFWTEGEVMANGTGVRVRNLVPQLDRSALLNPVVGDSVDISLPASGRITDVEFVGNALVAVEVRADGTWVEVFRATALRDVFPSTLLSAGDSRGAFRVSSYVPPVGTLATLTVTNGRALIGVNHATVGQNNLFVVDLRPLLDDLATTMSASNVLGAFQLANPVRGVSAQGTQVYACTSGGAVSFDLAPALNDPPAQVGTLPATRALASFQCDEVAAYGSYAFVVGYDSRLGLAAVDVSTPATPVPLSVLPGPGSSTVCFPAQDSGGRTIRSGVVVRGSRAWMNFRNGMREIELE